MIKTNRLLIPDLQGVVQDHIIEDKSARMGAAHAAQMLGVTELMPDITRGYIGSDGTISGAGSAYAALTDYIEVPAGGKIVIRWTGRTGTPGLRLGVYDDEQAWVKRTGYTPSTDSGAYTYEADPGTWLRINWDENATNALHGVSISAGQDFIGHGDVPAALTALQTQIQIDWRWTVGSLSTSTGMPSTSTIRIRSCHVPVGKGTRIVSSATGYRSLYVFVYGTDWSFTEATDSWVKEWTAESDCWIRVIMRAGGDDPTVTDVPALAALLSCPHYTAPAFEVSEELGRWMASKLVSGIPNGASAEALAMRDIAYADRTVMVETDGSTVQVVAAYYSAAGAFISQTNNTPVGMLCVPKGVYYRLSVFAVTAATASPALLDSVTIRKGDPLLWYGSTSAYGDIRIFTRVNTVITPDIRYSGRGLTVRCTDPDSSILWIRYDSPDPYGGLKWNSSYSSAAIIDPGCWYRLVIKTSNASIDPAEAEMHLIWERAEDLDPGIAAAGIAAVRHADPGEVPSYYESHIAAKAGEINDLRSSTCVQFAFITDYHSNGYSDGQAGHSGALLKYLADHTMLDLCVNCGDVAAGLGSWTGGTNDKAAFRKIVRDACAAMSPVGMVPLFVAGNHDGGISGGVEYNQLITAQELYMASGLQAIRGRVVSDQGCPLQYYMDDPVHNVRYIVGAVGLHDNVTGQSDEEAFRFITAALRTAPVNCGIVIFNHIILKHPYDTPADRTVLLTGLADAYNARNSDYKVTGNIGSNTVTYNSTRSNFSGCTGQVLAIIGGHSHFDYTYTTTGGIPVIVTTTDNAGGEFALSGGEASSAPRDTSEGHEINEQAFDVFTVEPATGAIYATRIGAGDDRSWYWSDDEEG